MDFLPGSLKTIRLHIPANKDLHKSLDKFFSEKQIKDWFIVTSSGDFKKIVIKHDADSQTRTLESSFKIVGLYASSNKQIPKIRCDLKTAEGSLIKGILLPGTIVENEVDLVIGWNISPEERRAEITFY
jgi:predicted DNA-binding protein with PD1-like motif